MLHYYHHLEVSRMHSHLTALLTAAEVLANKLCTQKKIK
jgi:hypothetical protein